MVLTVLHFESDLKNSNIIHHNLILVKG